MVHVMWKEAEWIREGGEGYADVGDLLATWGRGDLRIHGPTAARVCGDILCLCCHQRPHGRLGAVPLPEPC